MRVEEFTGIIEKVARFKERLIQEDIKGEKQQVVLKVYIQDLTNRINTNFLKVV